MTNRAWQAIEYTILSKMALGGKTDAEIGEILSRGSQEIFAARKRMGIASANANPITVWTIEEVKTLQAWFDLGRSDSQIAEALHRSVDSVASKRKALCLHRSTPEGYTKPKRRGLSAFEVLARRPLSISEEDTTTRAYATAAFLITLLRAGHTPGQGEFSIPSENRPVPHSQLVGA